LPTGDAERYLGPLNAAMSEWDINTPKRQAAFLAQVAEESGELIGWVESPTVSLPLGRRVGRGVVVISDISHYVVRTLDANSVPHDVTIYVSGPNFEAYDYRSSLGNQGPPDGSDYRGRGPIQITGRINYRAAGSALDLDLEGNPYLVSDKVMHPEVGLRVATWYWQSHGLNELADTVDPSDEVSTYLVNQQITRIVNGGYNGLALRYHYYLVALDVLNVP
jgi:putative chitinase